MMAFPAPIAAVIEDTLEPMAIIGMIMDDHMALIAVNGEGHVMIYREQTRIVDRNILSAIRRAREHAEDPPDHG